jgi:N-acetylglucosamine malate deacetylase 2
MVIGNLSLLCVVAHPDDETMLTGGTLAALAAAGAAVHVLCATRGEGGELGDPPICARENLGAVREAELVCAVGKLKGRSLTFLDYVDPVVGPGEELFPFEADLALFAGQIAASAKQHGAHVLLTHGAGGEYGHPAHKLVHTAVRVAVAGLRAADAPETALYAFSAAYPEHPAPRLANTDEPAHLLLDVSAWLDAKEAAALCHASQTALFVRRRSEQAGRTLTVREVLLDREGLHRHVPLVEGGLNDALVEFLREKFPGSLVVVER